MTLPKPPIQNNIDLRSFEFMPLDVVRFRDSDFTALVEAEAFRSGFLLMCASWHQVPAGSLPNDDRILSNLAGFGRVVKEWEKFKDEALRGWVLCDDNRYYHPVVCEKALESWNSKQEYNYKKFSERLRKANQKLIEHEQIAIPSFDVWTRSGMPDTWNKNSKAPALENINTHNEPKNKILGNANTVPREFQSHSSGIPLENILKGTEHNGQGQVRDIVNTHTIPPEENSAAEAWNPNLETLGSILKTTKHSQRVSEILSLEDFQFHLGNFNTHHENNHQLTDNQKHRKFAQWVVQEFEKHLAKAEREIKKSAGRSLPEKQNSRNVNDAWGQEQQYAPATNDIDTEGLL